MFERPTESLSAMAVQAELPAVETELGTLNEVQFNLPNGATLIVNQGDVYWGSFSYNRCARESTGSLMDR